MRNLLRAFALAILTLSSFSVAIPTPVEAQFLTPTIIMLAPAANRSFVASPSRNTYLSSNYGLIVNVVAGDVPSLQNQGCIILNPRDNVSTVRTPLTTDDFTAGFGVGSQWNAVISGTPTLWILTAMSGSPGSATWTQVSGPATAGTVSAGLAHQLATYLSNGTTVSGLATANNGFLLTNGSGVPAIGNSTLGNLFIGGGKPWCDVVANGAVADGNPASISTNIAAMQGCIDRVIAQNGGIIFIPPGNNVYCVYGLAVEPSFGQFPPVIIMGTGIFTSVLSPCGNDQTAITLNTFGSRITDVGVYGKGTNNDTGTFGATLPAVLLAGNCIGCVLEHMYIVGGSSPLDVSTVDALIFDVNVSQGYVNANIYTNGSNWYMRVKSDMPNWPAGNPNYGESLVTYSAATYGVGQAVQLGSCILQVTVSGTTTGSLGACKNYGVPIVDGTATMYFVRPATYASVYLDAGAVENRFHQFDMTGAFSSSVIAPAGHSGIVEFTESVFAGSYTTNFNLSSATQVGISSSNFGGCTASGCSTILINASYGNSFRFVNNTIAGPTAFAINNGGPSQLIVTDSNMTNIIAGQAITGAGTATAAISKNNIVNGAIDP